MDSIDNIRVSESDINVGKNEDGGMRSDSFVIDLESFSNGLNKESAINSTNSRITLQRSLSRKGHQRGAEKNNINDIDNLSPSSSPTGTRVTSMSEKPVSPLTPLDHTGNNNQLPQHQIIIKTGSLNPLAEGRWGKRSSFKRSSPYWFSDPKRILLFFATLSSVGTMFVEELSNTAGASSSNTAGAYSITHSSIADSAADPAATKPAFQLLPEGSGEYQLPCSLHEFVIANFWREN